MPNDSCTCRSEGATSWRRRSACSARLRIAMVVLAISNHVLGVEEFARLRRRALAVLNVVDSTGCAATRRATSSSFSFGPGPLSPAIKALIAVNVGIFVLMWLMPPTVATTPCRCFSVWCPPPFFGRSACGSPSPTCSCMRNIGHIFFNMLALWMFGTELERMWGTRYFLRYYFITGIVAAITTVARFVAVRSRQRRVCSMSVTIGASGAIYGLLLAYGLTFPNRPIYVYFVFPIPAKYFVMIMGVIALLSAMGDSGGGIAHITHLGGLVAGYVMLRGRHLSPANEVRYRYLRWKMDRARKKFGVYSAERTTGTSECIRIQWKVE